MNLVTGGTPRQPFSMGGRHRAFLDPCDIVPEHPVAISCWISLRGSMMRPESSPWTIQLPANLFLRRCAMCPFPCPLRALYRTCFLGSWIPFADVPVFSSFLVTQRRSPFASGSANQVVLSADSLPRVVSLNFILGIALPGNVGSSPGRR